MSRTICRAFGAPLRQPPSRPTSLRPAPLPHPAMHCPARPASGISRFLFRQNLGSTSFRSCCEVFHRFEISFLIPGHALHDIGLRRQKGIHRLISSNDRKAAVVPSSNRSATARQPPVKFFASFQIQKHVHAAAETSKTVVFGVLRVEDERKSPGHTAPPRVPLPPPRLRPASVLPNPAPPPHRASHLPRRLAPPCRALPVVCPGFGRDRLEGMQGLRIYQRSSSHGAWILPR